MKNTNYINVKKLTNIYFQNTNVQRVKMIIVLLYFKDRSSRMPMYVWDELYF